MNLSLIRSKFHQMSKGHSLISTCIPWRRKLFFWD